MYPVLCHQCEYWDHPVIEISKKKSGSKSQWSDTQNVESLVPHQWDWTFSTVCDKSFWFIGQFSQWMHKKRKGSDVPLSSVSHPSWFTKYSGPESYFPMYVQYIHTYLLAVATPLQCFPVQSLLWDSGALSIRIPFLMSGWTNGDDRGGSLPMMAAIFAKTVSCAFRLKPNNPAYALKKNKNGVAKSMFTLNQNRGLFFNHPFSSMHPNWVTVQLANQTSRCQWMAVWYTVPTVEK